MKKISVLLLLLFIVSLTAPQNSCSARIFDKTRTKIEQQKIYKSTVADIKKVIELQDKYANSQNLEGITQLYSKDFLNSDGFDKDAYVKLIKETWKTYPDISYTTKINNIEFTDNYATVFVEETAVATSKEDIDDLEVIGELYSTSRCVYHLEKQGTEWLISSERVIEERTSLKYGDARYMNISLDVPKQTGSNRYYTATLKVDTPDDALLVGSITREKIIYPQTKSEDAFRRIENGVLERMFLSNSEDVNEYAVASVGITRAEGYDPEHVRVYMSGMAFVMTRVNVIPENKYINIEDKDE